MRPAGIALIGSLVLAACGEEGPRGGRHRGDDVVVDDDEPRRRDRRDAGVGGGKLHLVPPDATLPLPTDLSRDPAVDVRSTGLPPGAIMKIGEPRWRMSGMTSAAPADDGSVVTCNRDQIRLWDPTAHLISTFAIASGDTRCVRSPDGRLVVVVGSYRPPALYDLATGATRWELGSRTTAADAAFSPDGSQLAIAADTSELRQTRDGAAVSSSLGPALAVGFRPGGEVVLVRTDEIAEWTSGSARRIAGAPGIASGGAVSQDGSHAAWIVGGQITIVELSGGQTTTIPRPTSDVLRVALSPDGQTVAGTTYDAVHAWKKDGTFLWTSPRVYGASLAFSPDGRSLWVGGYDRVARLEPSTGAITQVDDGPSFSGWNATGGAIVYQNGARAIDPRSGTPVTDTIAYDDMPYDIPDGYYAWVFGDTSVAHTGSGTSSCVPLEVWIRNSRKTRTLPAPDCDTEHSWIGWDVGPGVAISRDKGGPLVWDLVTGKKLFRMPKTAAEMANVVFSRDASTMLVTYYDDTVATWSIAKKKKLADASYRASPIVLSHDGARAFAWADGALEVVDTRTLTRQRLTPQPTTILELELSPDGSLLAATDMDRVTTIWRVPR